MFELVEYVEQKYGFSADRMRVLICAILCLPLGFILRRLCCYGRKVSNLFIIFIGLSFIWYTVGVACLHPLAMIAISYSFFYFLPTIYLGHVTLIYAMLHLSFCHIYRMYHDYNGYRLDVSGIMMVLVQKVSYAAYEQSEKVLKKDLLFPVPNLIEYLAYCLYYPSVLLGPSFTFTVFNNYINNITNSTKCNENIKVKNISYLFPSLKKYTFGIVYSLLYLICSQSVDASKALDEHFLKTSSFIEYMLYLCFICYTTRFQYYGAFLIMAGCCNASMLGYQGIDENNHEKWNLVDQIYPLKVDFATNFKQVTDNWNIQTANWIREITYKRSSKMKLFKSFMLSAIWHGFYPGYYITFTSGPIVVYLMRITRRNIRPLFLSNHYTKLFYDVVTWIFTQCYLLYFIIPFIYLNLSDSIKIMKKLNYMGHIVLLGCYLVYYIIYFSKKDNNISNVSKKHDNNIREQKKNLTYIFGIF